MIAFDEYFRWPTNDSETPSNNLPQRKTTRFIRRPPLVANEAACLPLSSARPSVGGKVAWFDMPLGDWVDGTYDDPRSPGGDHAYELAPLFVSSRNHTG